MDALNRPVERSLQTLDLRCPPLPQTFLEAIELTHNPNGPELEQVVELVQHDPVAVARTLRIVNSPYYGQRGHISSIHRAVLVVGPLSVVGVIMSMSMIEVRAALEEETAVSFLDLVRHSTATAFLAQQLLLNDPSSVPGDPALQERVGEAFTAGIMHDFGKLLLLYNFPDEAGRFYTAPAEAAAADLLAAEQAQFDFNHVEAGHFLAERLNLPEALVKAIAFHHTPEAPGALQQPQLTYLIAACNLAANAFGYSLNHAGSWSDCREDPIWQRMIDAGIVGYPSTHALLQTLEAEQEELNVYVDAIF